jgi:hypothetical protein
MENTKVSNQPQVTFSQSNDLGNNIYNNLCELGEFRTKLGLVFGIIIGIVLVIIGIYMILHDDSDDYIYIDGVVVQPNCSKSGTQTNKGSTIDTYACNMIISYEIDKNKHSEQIYVAGNNNYIAGQPIKLMVKKSDHTKVSIAETSSTIIGYVLIGIAIFINSLIFLQYYLTNRYKVYAASQGASTIMDMFR